MRAAVFADVSWLSYVHPTVLAESLAAVWQLRQGATWEQTGRHDDKNFNLSVWKDFKFLALTVGTLFAIFSLEEY